MNLEAEPQIQKQDSLKKQQQPEESKEVSQPVESDGEEDYDDPT